MKTTKERNDYHNHKKYNQYEEGKIQCFICKGWYKKICSHTTQRHNLDAKAYKKLMGKDNKKGLICEKSKELARQRNKENFDIVVKENLLKKGAETRFKEGHKLGKYKRSPQTLERLKKQFNNQPPENRK